MLASLVALALPVGAAIAYFYSRPEAVAKRALKRLPVTPIASARDGEAVKLVGKVVYAAPPIESPLELRRCAYYSFVVQKEGRGPAYELMREERGVDFYVQDGSGMALVRVGPDVSSALRKDRMFFTTIVDGDPDIERVLKARGRSTKGVLFYHSLRAREGTLVAGERVAVCGFARWVPDGDAPGGSYREMPMRLVLEASESRPLWLSDDPAVL